MAANAQKVRDKIDQALKDSNDIGAGNYVTVKTEKSGLFGKGYIVLSGRATSEAMITKIVEIAEAHAEGVEVKNQLRVSTVA